MEGRDERGGTCTRSDAGDDDDDNDDGDDGDDNAMRMTKDRQNRRTNNATMNKT